MGEMGEMGEIGEIGEIGEMGEMFVVTTSVVALQGMATAIPCSNLRVYHLAAGELEAEPDMGALLG
jgi:hypothetical protein